jgi:hypothetical protein
LEEKMFNCPKCGWEPPDYPFYYCNKGKAINCTRMVPNKSTVEENIDFSEDFHTIILKMTEVSGPNDFNLEGKPL